MSTSKTEYLSALLDDEAGAFEQRRLLDELKQDDELSHTLSRYALIGESLRSEQAVAPATVSLLSGIQDAIADEETHDAVQVRDSGQSSGNPIRKRPALPGSDVWKYGMAAAIGALSLGVVMTLQQPSVEQQAPLSVAQAVVAEQEAPVVRTAQAIQAAPLVPVAASGSPGALQDQDASMDSPVRYAQLDAETRDILKQYVAQHLRYASTTAIVPSFRTVSYENNN